MKPSQVRGLLGRMHRPRGQTLRVTYYAVVLASLVAIAVIAVFIAAAVIHAWRDQMAPESVTRAAQHNPYFIH